VSKSGSRDRHTTKMFATNERLQPHTEESDHEVIQNTELSSAFRSFEDEPGPPSNRGKNRKATSSVKATATAAINRDASEKPKASAREIKEEEGKGGSSLSPADMARREPLRRSGRGERHRLTSHPSRQGFAPPPCLAKNSSAERRDHRGLSNNRREEKSIGVKEKAWGKGGEKSSPQPRSNQGLAACEENRVCCRACLADRRSWGKKNESWGRGGEVMDEKGDSS